jgi:predicted metalloprotease
MLWTPGGRSPNLEDRRSGGGGMGRGLGIGGTVVVLALSLLFGRNLFTDLGVEPAGVSAASTPLSPADSAVPQPESVEFLNSTNFAGWNWRLELDRMLAHVFCTSSRTNETNWTSVS